jgi:uncharacterized membrane protein YeaQ/YmgE (transglycosylase-associated protein family)
MDSLAWIVVGLIAGWLASQAVHGGGYGPAGDIVVGMVGAVIGGFLAGAVFNSPDTVNGINISSIFVAFVGSVILIVLLRSVSGRRLAKL